MVNKSSYTKAAAPLFAIMAFALVLGCQPLVGNLHRCCEKILECLTYTQGLPYVDRMDYLGALNMELGLVLAVEQAAAVEVPKRAQYLRVIMCEINRVISHLLG